MTSCNAGSVRSETIRLATWNLERCSSRWWKRKPAQDRRIDRVDADIWVLTETFTDRSPSPDFDAVFSPPHPERRPDPNERWTGIWSRWPIRALDAPAPHRRGTVAAEVDTPLGLIVVYGCVIAWSHEPTFDDGTPAGVWNVHAADIERQASEWRWLREHYPSRPLVVAGDFNQGRSGRRWDYGTHALRQQLSDRLDHVGLRSLTDIDLVEAGPLVQSHVQHICVSPELAASGDVLAWERTDGSGQRLSDHPTLAVDLTVAD